MANYTIPTYPAQRPRYYNNQFLRDQDFIDDQAHQLSMARAHLRSLCVAGVCEGLTVQTNGDDKLTIGPGVAIDAAGHMIALDATKPGPDASALADGDYRLHITFHEEEDVMAPPVEGGAQGNTRFTQRPILGATPAADAIPAGAVVLGAFTVADAAVSAVSAAGRQYSGLRFPGPNASAAATATHRGDGSADGVLLGGDLTIRRDVPGGTIGPTLTLMNGVGFPGGTGSGAAIDFDGYDPGEGAPALRLQSIGDNAGSSHLAISTKAPGANANNLVERLRITSLGVLQFPNEAKDKLIIHDGYGLGWNNNNLALFCPPAGRLSLRQGSSSGTEVFTVSGTGAATFAGNASFRGAVSVDGNATFRAATFDQEATFRQTVAVDGKATFHGVIVPKPGNSPEAGILFGGGGDMAYLRHFATEGTRQELRIGIENDPEDAIVLWQKGAARLTIAHGKVEIHQEDWQAPQLKHKWVNFGAGYNNAAYFKDSCGVVHLRGLVKNGDSGTGNPIFTLPPGYRPEARQLHGLTHYGGSGFSAVLGRLDIMTNGDVCVLDGHKTWVSLDGISFRAINAPVVAVPVAVPVGGDVVSAAAAAAAVAGGESA